MNKASDREKIETLLDILKEPYKRKSRWITETQYLKFYFNPKEEIQFIERTENGVVTRYSSQSD